MAKPDHDDLPNRLTISNIKKSWAILAAACGLIVHVATLAISLTWAISIMRQDIAVNAGLVDKKIAEAETKYDAKYAKKEDVTLALGKLDRIAEGQAEMKGFLSAIQDKKGK